jgi:tRNA nucleotidyltransferase (CCA-adding enzyme)
VHVHVHVDECGDATVCVSCSPNGLRLQLGLGNPGGTSTSTSTWHVDGYVYDRIATRPERAAMSDELDRLARAVPANVRDVCATLTAAGHQAVTVGGAVRDALLGRDPGDWDVASSAHPDEVMKLFRRTIPTGLQHGTVVVVTGRGEHMHVEVTTFRGEGAYSDARRPDHVTFGVPLVEDLARRDLTVNAIAYDPAKHELIDPFGGREDIEQRRLRAVGNAVDRFTEDGLRVMRAVRFAAQLEFDLDATTEAGIPPALPSLAKVSRERVSVELRKTLATRQPSRGLAPARRTGIVASVLPELDAAIVDEAAWLARIDRAPEAVRLGAMLVPLQAKDAPTARLDRQTVRRIDDLLKALKFSNDEAGLAAQLVAVAHCTCETTWSATQVRRLLAELDRDKRPLAVELWRSEEPACASLIGHATHILDEKHPLVAGDLAIGGKDLMSALGMKPGPALGRILARLVDFVHEDPARNTRDTLLTEAQRLELEVGHER